MFHYLVAIYRKAIAAVVTAQNELYYDIDQKLWENILYYPYYMDNVYLMSHEFLIYGKDLIISLAYIS
jgi:hypothetical protein